MSVNDFPRFDARQWGSRQFNPRPLGGNLSALTSTLPILFKVHQNAPFLTNYLDRFWWERVRLVTLAFRPPYKCSYVRTLNGCFVCETSVWEVLLSGSYVPGDIVSYSLELGVNGWLTVTGGASQFSEQGGFAATQRVSHLLTSLLDLLLTSLRWSRVRLIHNDTRSVSHRS